MIHSTAIIDVSATIADDCEIGPYCVIGPNVSIGSGTVLGPHVVVKGNTRIGCNNHILQFASVGEIPQDLKFKGEETWLEIGDHNRIREFTTINRGTGDGGGLTKIGSHNLLMAYVHIAHDCILGDHIIFSNNASIAGHVEVMDHAIVGPFSGVHQFCRVGRHAFSGINSIITQDLAPYVLCAGHPAKTFGLNKEGLKRRGFDDQTIRAIQRAYVALVKRKYPRDEALEVIASDAQTYPEVAELRDFVLSSERGVLR